MNCYEITIGLSEVSEETVDKLTDFLATLFYDPLVEAGLGTTPFIGSRRIDDHANDGCWVDND